MLRNHFIFFIVTVIFSSNLFAEFISIGNEDLTKMMQKGVAVIDIRTPPEWKKTGIIPGSHKLMFYDENGHSNPQQWLQEFNKIVNSNDQPFVLVCHSGGRSEMVGQFLDDKVGMKRVYHLKDGISSWKEERRNTVE